MVDGTKNILSVDVEDYHSIISRVWFDKDISPSKSVVEYTLQILGLLDKYKKRATFFVLGEVAEHYPGLIKRIYNTGHEVGLHGYKHLLVSKLTPKKFREETITGKKIIEDIIGDSIKGHRAPAFSITSSMKWAFEILIEQGFIYDSSIYPIKGRRYGDVSASLDPFVITTSSGQIWEVPPATLEILGKRIPVCGGGYLRILPFWFNMWAFRKISACRPVVVYLHPYELELKKSFPPDPLWDFTKKLRYTLTNTTQYYKRKYTSKKLEILLKEFDFTTIWNVYGDKFRSD